MVVVLGLVLASCGSSDEGPVARGGLPERLAPDSIGDIALQREPSLEAGFAKAGANALVDEGRIFSIRRGDEVLGSVQMAPFRRGLIRSKRDLDEVRLGVVTGIGNGTFKPVRAGSDVVLAQRGARTTFYLWFDPGSTYFQLMVAGREMKDPEALFASLLAYQRGEDPTMAVDVPRIEQVDSRRGGVD
jgi:hypothetical protein